MKFGKIEKDIPIPGQIVRGIWIDRLGKMEIGESFLVIPEKEEDLHLITNRVSAAICKYVRREKDGKKFVTRRTMRLKPSIRVWRVE